MVLDRELVALAGMHSRCRLVQARLARRLLHRRAWRHLGFVRLGDYARERLGLAPRTLEDDARVLAALDTLPLLRAALESGGLTWSRARVLVRAAAPGNEATLLQRAAAVPLRELDSFVREFRSQPPGAGESPDALASTERGNVRIGDDPEPDPERDREHDPEHDRGHDPDHDSQYDPQYDPAHHPEHDPELRWGITVSRSGRRLWNAAREAASRMAGSPLSPGQALELVAAESAGADAPSRWLPEPAFHQRRFRSRLEHDEERGRRFLLAFLAETGVVEGFGWLAPASPGPGPARMLDALLDGLDQTDSFEIDRRLRELRRAAQRIDAQMAALLFIGINRRLFREIGFATVKLYVESRLGCSARTAWSMIAVERSSWRCSSMLREAWREGQLSHLAVSAILPVVSEKNAEAWIARAGEVTLRRLHDEVAWALDHGQAPSSSTKPWPPGPDAEVRADGTGEVGDREVQMRARPGSAEDAWLGPPGAVRIECTVPLSVAVLVETTLDRLQATGEARWQAFERMVALALLEWTSQPRHRDPVFERDGWRCTVPACSSRRSLQDHHLRFRSHGGDNSQANRTTVCAAHHLHGIHAGIVRASGRAPGQIVWELGCARGREPLMRLRGDRFVGQAATTKSSTSVQPQPSSSRRMRILATGPETALTA